MTKSEYIVVTVMTMNNNMEGQQNRRVGTAEKQANAMEAKGVIFATEPKAKSKRLSNLSYILKGISKIIKVAT